MAAGAVMIARGMARCWTASPTPRSPARSRSPMWSGSGSPALPEPDVGPELDLDGDHVVRGVRGRRGGEPGVRQVQPVVERRDRGRHVEARVADLPDEGAG